MKKVILLYILVFIPFITVNAVTTTTTVVEEPVVEKYEVTLDNCNSINQIWINKNKKVVRIGLLAYDSGDTTIENDIKNTICTKLKEVNKIEIEYDINNKTKDKYNRDMVWVYVDGNLLQEMLIKEGFGMVNFINGEYSYIDNLCVKEATAIKNKKGIWSLGAQEKYCDSGIILEKLAKEEEEKVNGKKLDKFTIRKLVCLGVSIVLLIIAMLIKVKYEKKR